MRSGTINAEAPACPGQSGPVRSANSGSRSPGQARTSPGQMAIRVRAHFVRDGWRRWQPGRQICDEVEKKQRTSQSDDARVGEATAATMTAEPATAGAAAAAATLHDDRRCTFYMVQKQRRCGMMCKKGCDMCSEHSGFSSQGTAARRVPCPLDPKHSVCESNLRKHLLKCSKLKLRHANDDKPYYCLDFNAAAHRCHDVGAGSGGDADGGVNDDNADINEIIVKMIPILEDVYSKNFVDELPLDVKRNDFMLNGRFNQLVANKKHAIQQSSLIQHLCTRNLTRNTSFVEFGCGRAELSRYVNQFVTHENTARSSPHSQHFVLIDRASNRMKFDKKFADDFEEMTGSGAPHPMTHRYRIDIKDLKLDPLLQDGNYVAISKHLCGVATDLALRCIANSEKLVQPGQLQLQGLCIAMCCRHICDSEEYVNPAYIRELIRDYDADYTSFFRALQKMCSWATCGRKPGLKDDDTNGHFTQLTVQQRESLGFMARRIIDHGRYKWIASIVPQDYKVELLRYVPLNVSLENVAMIIHK